MQAVVHSSLLPVLVYEEILPEVREAHYGVFKG